MIAITTVHLVSITQSVLHIVTIVSAVGPSHSSGASTTPFPQTESPTMVSPSPIGLAFVCSVVPSDVGSVVGTLSSLSLLLLLLLLPLLSEVELHPEAW